MSSKEEGSDDAPHHVPVRRVRHEDEFPARERLRVSLEVDLPDLEGLVERREVVGPILEGAGRVDRVEEGLVGARDLLRSGGKVWEGTRAERRGGERSKEESQPERARKREERAEQWKCAPGMELDQLA